MINTRKAARRNLRFETVEALLSDIDQIEAAAVNGTLGVTGNWTPGQVLSHLAAWIEYGYDGFPIAPPPAPIRWILRWMLPGTLRNGMRPGVRIPGVKLGTTGADDVPLADGLRRYRTAISRLTSEPAIYPSPAFGPLSETDRVALQLRHAELHLSFLTLEKRDTA